MGCPCGVSKRGETPLETTIPLPHDKGKGIKGMGLFKISIINSWYRKMLAHLPDFLLDLILNIRMVNIGDDSYYQ